MSSRASRLAAHGAVSTALALLGDGELCRLLDTATPAGAGIGGTSAVLEVAGVPVFVKRVPLTDLERRPENVGSTADVFGLPLSCHYGIGGPGFGAWRELAAQTMTSDWALAGRYEGFPLLYHWRVLPHRAPLPDELADVEATVAFWGGGTPVRRRVEGLRDASACIALFLEHFPDNVFQWLRRRLRAGGDSADQACAMVDRDLSAGIGFMNARGLLHFDAHFHNLLTDGERLYFADYGLAISSGFALSQGEAEFFRRHQDYDRRFTAMYMAQWLVAELFGTDREERRARLDAYAAGRAPHAVPPAAAAILARDAPTALAMTDFFDALQHRTRDVTYPLAWPRR